MEAYPNEPEKSKPVALFELVADLCRGQVRLADRVTTALAAIRPWSRSLVDRLHRTWDDNPNYHGGPHAHERWDRERELRADLALLHRTRHFVACQRLPLRLRASAAALLEQVSRLLAGTDWWKPRPRVDRRTGEIVETTYLPEDTWAAQTALNYAVSFLGRLLAAVPRTTERATPAYKPGEATTGPDRRWSGFEEWKATLARAAARGEPPGGQPELPAQS
jgi:hypothetical protein